jgi:hypothetical protein
MFADLSQLQNIYCKKNCNLVLYICILQLMYVKTDEFCKCRRNLSDVICSKLGAPYCCCVTDMFFFSFNLATARKQEFCSLLVILFQSLHKKI